MSRELGNIHQCSLPQPPSPAIHFHLLFLDDFVFLQKKCMGKGFHLRSHYSVKWKNAADAEAGSEEEKMFCAPGVWKGAAVAGQGSRAEMQPRFPSHHSLGGVSRWGPTGKGPAAKVGCFCGPTLPRSQAHKCLAFRAKGGRNSSRQVHCHNSQALFFFSK